MTTWTKAAPTDVLDAIRADNDLGRMVRAFSSEVGRCEQEARQQREMQPIDRRRAELDAAQRLLDAIHRPDEIAALRAAVASLAVERRGHDSECGVYNGRNDGPCTCEMYEWNATVRAARAALGGGPVTDWQAVREELTEIVASSLDRHGAEDPDDQARRMIDAAVARHTKGGA